MPRHSSFDGLVEPISTPSYFMMKIGNYFKTQEQNYQLVIEAHTIRLAYTILFHI